MIYDECVKIRAHGLLYVNRKFHNDLRAHFNKEDFVLGFHIDPSSSSTTVTIINPDNSTWGRHSVLDVATPHPDYSILDSMPIDRFRGIRILIDPPNIHDPGQVVRGWLQSTSLVTALLPRWADPEKIPVTEEDIVVPKSRVSARLPPIAIKVRDGKTHKWHTGGSWNRTLPDITAWDQVQRRLVDNGESFSDLELMLTPLARVRNTDAISFDLPSGAPVGGSCEDLQNRLVGLATRKKLFGLERSDYPSIPEGFEEREDDDDDMQIDEDGLYVWLDYLLDDMRGPSAAALRRDRFKFWCSEYDYQMGRRIHGTRAADQYLFGGAQWAMSAVLYEAIENSFHDRFMSLREHENAAYRDVLRRHGQSVYIHANRMTDRNVHSEKVYIRRLEDPELRSCLTF
ncbi:hypothetical protein A1O3_03963 [Capronia epimyces CBS 606.96]|uniref:Uncharacterized protein n=1 Tax=Capronia epimyces CBS 606.96 TaxID=1182542 RepID=W9YCN4_9EURO|nr:uncharacterized protein A1O3_03963 [Capronia epimyces CBS 606.96]EXJ87006.1 hypothetical protein A1O3_03963 [Capronia epimyces CBS 606.96]